MKQKTFVRATANSPAWLLMLLPKLDVFGRNTLSDHSIIILFTNKDLRGELALIVILKVSERHINRLVMTSKYLVISSC